MKVAEYIKLLKRLSPSADVFSFADGIFVESAEPQVVLAGVSGITGELEYADNWTAMRKAKTDVREIVVI